MPRLWLPKNIIESRRRAGADRWDEMWDGELHMVPLATLRQRDLESQLAFWLHRHWAEDNSCHVHFQVNVSEPGTWPNNYRIPDVVMITPSRFGIDQNEYFNGGPDAVVEIHCPEDEAYEKLGFYGKIGVREVWIIDRDTKVPQIFSFEGDAPICTSPDADGWVRSGVVGAHMHSGNGKLTIQLLQQPDTLAHLP